MIDRRYVKVECDHAQSRLSRPRLNFTLRGFDFIDGQLVGCWINPVTGKLQPIPNSEEGDYQKLNTGRFRKLQLSDGTSIDSNTPFMDMVTFGPDHEDQGMKYPGDNVTGVGFVTTATQPANLGWNCAFYAHGKGTDQDGILGEIFWADDQNLTGGGVGIKLLLDGKVEIFKDSTTKPVFRGAFQGGGYTPGSVRGGAYARASDQYVMIRVEVVQGRFILLTSSLGGVCQFAPPWAIDQYDEDGDLLTPASDILPAKKWGWYVPKGGASVIAAPVIYGYSSPYAISELYQFAEVPTPSTDPDDAATDILTTRVIPHSDAVTVSLLKEDGVSAYERTTGSRKFRVKVAFSQAAFVSGVVGAYPRLRKAYLEPEDGPYDLTPYLQGLERFSVEDGIEGASIEIKLSGDCTIPFIDETEMRPFKITLIPNPDDGAAPDACLLLDGVGETPQWADDILPKAQTIHIRISDRTRLVAEAQFSETTVFDGLPLCRPPGVGPGLGDSVIGICYREGGLTNEELSTLPTILNADGDPYMIDDTPGQMAGDWNFAAKARQLVSDILAEAWEMAPQYAWGLKPVGMETRAYAVDVEDDEAENATFYRSPETAALDPEYEENELGAWPLLYGVGHTRVKLPKEGNVVRVNGEDPGTGKGIQAFVKDYDSADPQSEASPTKLGLQRQIFIRKRALTTQVAVNLLARRLDLAISKRQYTEAWPAFMRFKSDGSPIWRGDMVLLKEAKRDGSDSKVRVSGFSVDLRDENGGGLADEGGRQAPVSIRLTEYSGGAIVGLGGATAWEIAARHKEKVADGGSQYGSVDTAESSMAFVNRLT